MLFHWTFAAQHPLCPRSSPIGDDTGKRAISRHPQLRLWSRCAETISDRARQLAHAVRNVFRQVGRASTQHSKRLLQTQRLRNKLSLLSSCKLQQGSVEQCICAGRSCPQRLHHDFDTRCQVCQRCVGPRRCRSKLFCRLESRVAGVSVSRQCLRHSVCKPSRARAAR